MRNRERYAVLGYAGKHFEGGHYWDIFARGLRRKRADRVLEAYADRGLCGLHVEPDAVADDEQAARRYWEWMCYYADKAFK